MQCASNTICSATARCAEAYYGVHTLRALENFPITGVSISIYPDLVIALACVKQAAALANNELSLLDDAKAQAIVKACEEIREGGLLEEFLVDVIQGGAGTSTNMNANEVIANRALELMGRKRGEYEYLHPVEDVNMSQSTNDVYPTAIKVALHLRHAPLDGCDGGSGEGLAGKEQEFADVLKIGRTQLQDAVPMTLGPGVFDLCRDSGGRRPAREKRRSSSTRSTLVRPPSGPVSTRIPTMRHWYAASSPISPASPSSRRATWWRPRRMRARSCRVSGVLKRIAVKLSKTCNDLRLLLSGPRAGLNEINLPPVQAGSSIMPGKVNPVIPEVVNQVAFEVIGNDVTVSFAAEAGQLQLNAFEPIIAHSLFEACTPRCATPASSLPERCVKGITANREHLRRVVENSIGIVTALNYTSSTHATQVAAGGARDRQSVLRSGAGEEAAQRGSSRRSCDRRLYQTELRPKPSAGITNRVTSDGAGSRRRGAPLADLTPGSAWAADRMGAGI